MDMAKISWSVLSKDREMLIISVAAIVPFFALLIMYATVAGSLLDSILNPTSIYERTLADIPDGTSHNEPMQSLVQLTLSLPIVLFFLVCIAEFAQGALIAAAHDRMTGGDPTIRSALRSASRAFSALMVWAAIKYVINLITSAARRSSSRPSSTLFALELGETAWHVASYLTVPAIVIDRMGTIEAIKRSFSLLRKTWGENLAGNFGFGLLGLLCMLPGFVVLSVAGFPVVDFLMVFVLENENTDLDILHWANLETIITSPGILLGGLWVVAVLVFINTLSMIYKTAVYIYATREEGVANGVAIGFEQVDLQKVFTVKAK